METQGLVNLKAEYRNDHREEERKGAHGHKSSQGLVHKHLNTLSPIYFLNKITFGEESMIHEMQVQAGKMQTKSARYTRTSWCKPKTNPPDQSVRRTPRGQAMLAQRGVIYVAREPRIQICRPQIAFKEKTKQIASDKGSFLLT